ncbi:MAG: hypothetical protein RL299_336, partial [Pseudomonadota bacterium]
MREWADFTAETEADGALRVALTGPMVVSSVGELDVRLRELGGPVTSIDLSGVGSIDTVGAWIVSRLSDEYGAAVTGASQEAQRLIAAVRETDLSEPEEGGGEQGSALTRLLGKVGAATIGYKNGVVELLDFLGALLIAAARVLRHPSRMRWISLVRQIELVGVGALPIVGLMSFLIGIVIAQQGAVQLRQFGAEIYTVNLTGRLSFRELGILMTAIMFAGRSGSSFAAQIGTMKLTEE